MHVGGAGLGAHKQSRVLGGLEVREGLRGLPGGVEGGDVAVFFAKHFHETDFGGDVRLVGGDEPREQLKVLLVTKEKSDEQRIVSDGRQVGRKGLVKRGHRLRREGIDQLGRADLVRQNLDPLRAFDGKARGVRHAETARGVVGKGKGARAVEAPGTQARDGLREPLVLVVGFSILANPIGDLERQHTGVTLLPRGRKFALGIGQPFVGVLASLDDRVVIDVMQATHRNVEKRVALRSHQHLSFADRAHVKESGLFQVVSRSAAGDPAVGIFPGTARRGQRGALQFDVATQFGIALHLAGIVLPRALPVTINEEFA
ncbi:MAG: hypothetical protein K0R17_409 [Rariglobus sp.]|nr:hypothetical protein [Rariglobus sp.]